MSDGLGGFANARFLHSLEGMADAAVRRREAEAELERTQRLVAQIQELENWNAGNLAEKQALRVALAKVCPDHPLLTNTILQEKVKEAGRRALTLTGDWDAARNAGGSFKYDD